MTLLAATTAVLLLAVLAVLQVLLAAGRPYGRLVWGGQHDVLPRSLRIGSAISVVIYAAMAATLLSRAGVFGPPPDYVAVATWVLVGYSTLGVVVNGISRSRAERLVMTPTCVALTVSSLVVATA